ncbi:autotransporter domain-containing protein [Chitinimonas sp. BJYL2]|uniref:autotransporter domain-containing protein n=1 Tax=Chitinimonas sp. BJYL2 TaxID=2976696 RepID=UPI0022B441D2|nr:autotransporter domain-containing protein [Chitinimonas sp. BJYL2]
MKRFPLARSIVTTALVGAAFAPAAHAAGHYTNIYVFGDSLSDVGYYSGMPAAPGVTFPEGNRWTIDGAKSDLYVDYLAKQFGLKSTARKPAAAGGNNYAPGGGRATGSDFRSLTSQVTTFLGDVGGKADPNALYVVTVGGNDMADALKSALATGNSAGAQAIATDAVSKIVTQVGALQSKGAKRIIVSNSPDIGKVPQIFNTVLGLAPASLAANLGASASVVQSLKGLAAAGIGLPDLSGNAALVAALSTNVSAATGAAIGVADIGAAQAAARAKLNASTAGISATNPAYLEAAQAALASYGGKLAPAAAAAFAQTLQGALAQQGINLSPAQVAGITGALTQSYQAGLVAGAGNLVTQFNTVASTATSLIDSVYHPALNYGLGKLGGEIVYADVNRLMKEVVANPTAFGVGNVTGYACPTGVGANFCTSAAADSSKTFFYSDDFHPTPQAHKMVGQYMMSLLNAPYFAAQLVNGQAVAGDAALGALDARSMAKRSVGAVSTIAHVSRLGNDLDGSADALRSDGKNTAVTVGLDYQVFGNMSAGAAFTHVKNETEFADNMGGFESTNQVLSAFGNTTHGAFSLETAAYFGSTRFNDIKRKVQLGSLARTEQGDTSGTIAGLRLAGSYLISLGKISVSPTLSVAFRENKVGGYLETCSDSSYASSCSSSMRYGKQRVTSLLGGAGVKVEADMGMFQPFGSAMYYSESKDKNRRVEAAQFAAVPSFKTDVFTPDDSYGVVNVGARTSLGKSFSAYAVYNHVFGASEDKRDALSVGVQASF